MVKAVKEVKVFVPGHATCFFSPQITGDPLTTGSVGAGFCTELGTLIKLRCYPGSGNDIRVSFSSSQRNLSERLTNAPVSRLAAELYLKQAEISAVVDFTMDLDFPVGIGLGTSAGGALGAVLALNEIYGTLSVVETQQIAHIAEVIRKTGLGDVIAQTCGGFETRTIAGAPGIGKVIQYPEISADVLIIVHGTMKTRPVLESQAFRVIAESLGKELLEDFLSKITLSNLTRLGQIFARRSGLLTRDVQVFLDRAASIGLFEGSMVLIGNTSFLFIDDPKKVAKKLGINRQHYYQTTIANSGALVLS